MSLYTSLPKGFYLGPTHFIDAFQEVATSLGDTKETAQELFGLLPRELKFAPAFFLLLTKRWCYEFGEVFDRLPQNQIVLGSEQFPEVENLYLGLRAVDKHLSRSQLLAFLEKLGNPAKHLETLAELAPLLRILANVKPSYEVQGYGHGNRRIDWLFTPQVGIPILVDVKYRIIDLIQHLSQMIPALNAGEREFPPPELDPSILFKDTVEKFIPRSSSNYLQGVWIHAHVKQDESKLEGYFKNLDAERLHFAILCRWRSSAYILCRDSIDKNYISGFFDLNLSNTFVL